MKRRSSVLFGITLCLLGVSRPVAAQYGPQYAPRGGMMPSVNSGMRVAYGQPLGQPVYAGQPVLAAQPVEFIAPMPPTAYVVSAPRSNIRVAVATEEDLAPANSQKGACSDDDGCKADEAQGDADLKACGCVDKCCCKAFAFRFYGDFLYLRARDAEVCYAVESNVNAPNTVPIQKSPIGMLDQEAGTGFRVGFGFGLTEYSELAVGYTHFETATSDAITRVRDIQQITAMTLHPETVNAATGTVEANAHHDIDMDLIDLDYRHMLWCGCRANLTGVVGVRWGRMQQSFGADYTDALKASVADARVATDIDFDGLGLRLGFEGETFAPHRRLMFYAKGYANFLAGEFDATYRQASTGGNPDVDTQWQAGRIVPTFDFEVGTGYYSPCGRLRVTVGYLLSVWTNTVKTEDFIHAVQTNDFRDMGDSMTFDGLVARVEGRF